MISRDRPSQTSLRFSLPALPKLGSCKPALGSFAPLALSFCLMSTKYTWTSSPSFDFVHMENADGTRPPTSFSSRKQRRNSNAVLPVRKNSSYPPPLPFHPCTPPPLSSCASTFSRRQSLAVWLRRRGLSSFPAPRPRQLSQSLAVSRSLLQSFAVLLFPYTGSLNFLPLNTFW